MSQQHGWYSTIYFVDFLTAASIAFATCTTFAVVTNGMLVKHSKKTFLREKKILTAGNRYTPASKPLIQEDKVKEPWLHAAYYVHYWLSCHPRIPSHWMILLDYEVSETSEVNVRSTTSSISSMIKLLLSSIWPSLCLIWMTPNGLNPAWTNP